MSLSSQNRVSTSSKSSGDVVKKCYVTVPSYEARSSEVLQKTTEFETANPNLSDEDIDVKEDNYTYYRRWYDVSVGNACTKTDSISSFNTSWRSREKKHGKRGHKRLKRFKKYYNGKKYYKLYVMLCPDLLFKGLDKHKTRSQYETFRNHMVCKRICLPCWRRIWMKTTKRLANWRHKAAPNSPVSSVTSNFKAMAIEHVGASNKLGSDIMSGSVEKISEIAVTHSFDHGTNNGRRDVGAMTSLHRPISKAQQCIRIRYVGRGTDVDRDSTETLQQSPPELTTVCSAQSQGEDGDKSDSKMLEDIDAMLRSDVKDKRMIQVCPALSSATSLPTCENKNIKNNQKGISRADCTNEVINMSTSFTRSDQLDFGTDAAPFADSDSSSESSSKSSDIRKDSTAHVNTHVSNKLAKESVQSTKEREIVQKRDTCEKMKVDTGFTIVPEQKPVMCLTTPSLLPLPPTRLICYGTKIQNVIAANNTSSSAQAVASRHITESTHIGTSATDLSCKRSADCGSHAAEYVDSAVSSVASEVFVSSMTSPNIGTPNTLGQNKGMSTADFEKYLKSTNGSTRSSRTELTIACNTSVARNQLFSSIMTTPQPSPSFHDQVTAVASKRLMISSATSPVASPSLHDRVTAISTVESVKQMISSMTSPIVLKTPSHQAPSINLLYQKKPTQCEKVRASANLAQNSVNIEVQCSRHRPKCTSIGTTYRVECGTSAKNIADAPIQYSTHSMDVSTDIPNFENCHPKSSPSLALLNATTNPVSASDTIPMPDTAYSKTVSFKKILQRKTPYCHNTPLLDTGATTTRRRDSVSKISTAVSTTETMSAELKNTCYTDSTMMPKSSNQDNTSQGSKGGHLIVCGLTQSRLVSKASKEMNTTCLDSSTQSELTDTSDTKCTFPSDNITDTRMRKMNPAEGQLITASREIRRRDGSVTDSAVSSNLDAAKWIKRCTGNDKEFSYMSNATLSHKATWGSLKRALIPGTYSDTHPPPPNIKKPTHQGDGKVNTPPVFSMSEDSLSDCSPDEPPQQSSTNTRMKEPRVRLSIMKQPYVTTKMVDETTSDTRIPKEIKEITIQTVTLQRDTETQADTTISWKHSTVGVVTSRCILPCAEPGCGSCDDCVYVYGSPRCAIHRLRADAAVQLRPYLLDKPVQQAAECSGPSTPALFSQPQSTFRELLSPSVYNTLYQRKKMAVNAQTSSDDFFQPFVHYHGLSSLPGKSYRPVQKRVSVATTTQSGAKPTILSKSQVFPCVIKTTSACQTESFNTLIPTVDFDGTSTQTDHYNDVTNLNNTPDGGAYTQTSSPVFTVNFGMVTTDVCLDSGPQKAVNINMAASEGVSTQTSNIRALNCAAFTTGIDVSSRVDHSTNTISFGVKLTDFGQVNGTTTQTSAPVNVFNCGISITEKGTNPANPAEDVENIPLFTSCRYYGKLISHKLAKTLPLNLTPPSIESIRNSIHTKALKENSTMMPSAHFELGCQTNRYHRARNLDVAFYRRLKQSKVTGKRFKLNHHPTPRTEIINYNAIISTTKDVPTQKIDYSNNILIRDDFGPFADIPEKLQSSRTETSFPSTSTSTLNKTERVIVEAFPTPPSHKATSVPQSSALINKYGLGKQRNNQAYHAQKSNSICSSVNCSEKNKIPSVSINKSAPNSQISSHTSTRNRFGDGRSQASGYVKTVSDHLSKQSVLSGDSCPKRMLSHTVNLSDIESEEGQHLQSVYVMLSAIEGRIRRIKLKMPPTLS